MIEDYLEKLRKEYLKISPPAYLVYDGWRDLSVKLDTKKTIKLNLLFARGLAFAAIVLLLSGGVVGAAQAAKPGDALYPVKIAADDAFAKVSGKVEIKVERRAQDIIDVSGDSQKQLEEASRQYQKSLQEFRQDAQKSGKGQDLANTLDEQEGKFKKALEKNPQSTQNLEEAIKQTQQVRGQVRGERDEQQQEDNNHTENNGNNKSGENHNHNQNFSNHNER